MRKQLLSLVAVACAAVTTTSEVQAQAIDLIGGARFKVVAPANLQGARNFTYSYTSGSPWGGDIANNPLISQKVVQAIGTGNNNTDSLLCSSAFNGTALSGNIAIFYRGSCSFSEKASNAEAAGAIAAVIINNAPGNPIPMGATAGFNVTIPVFMISDVDGAALMNAIRNGVDTRLTITKWGSGAAGDIALIPNFNATYHAGAIPWKQLTTANGNPRQYRAYTGDVVANFGTDTAKNMVLTREISWKPMGGSYSLLTSDTAHLSSLAPEDSIDLIFNRRAYMPHASGPGWFMFKNRLNSPASDIDTVDNINTSYVYASDSIYSTTAWDTVNMCPSYVGGVRLASSGPLAWGPLFYTAIGGDYPSKMQFTLATDNAGDLVGKNVTTAAFKFNDGANGNPVDGIFQEGELDLIALGYYEFGVNDTDRYSTFVVPFNASLGSGPIPALDPQSTYWYAVFPSDGAVFFATNSDENPFMRSFASNKVDTTQYNAPYYSGDINDVINNLSNSANYRMFPFYSTNSADSVGVDQTSSTPAIALHVSSTPLGVKNAGTPLFNAFDVFPNPTKGDLNIRWSATKSFGTATITLFNGVGQAVQNFKTSDQSGQVQLSLSHLPAGNYWVVFASNEGIDSRPIKIVK